MASWVGSRAVREDDIRYRTIRLSPDSVSTLITVAMACRVQMNWTFERVAGPYEFTEGPVRDGEGVVFTDVPNDRIM